MVSVSQPEAMVRRRQLACWLAGILLLAPFLLVSFYNHPQVDDFLCPALVRNHGFWKTEGMLYDRVPPRYFELALSSLTPLSFGNFSGYKIIPFAFILL